MGDNSGPQLDPICELFRKGDPGYRTMSSFNRWFTTIGAATIGVGTALIMNMVARRPNFAGVHRHVIMGTMGAAFGEWAYRVRMATAAEKDFAFYHYMTLHPEDFPPPKKILFRDYLEPWLPIR